MRQSSSTRGMRLRPNAPNKTPKPKLLDGRLLHICNTQFANRARLDSWSEKQTVLKPTTGCLQGSRAYQEWGWPGAPREADVSGRDTVISTVEKPSSRRFLPTTTKENLSVPEKSGLAK